MIDYQPAQISSRRSIDHDVLLDNIVRHARTAVLFEFPIVLPTVNVGAGRTKGTVPDLPAELPPLEEIDRTQINAWEDSEFRAAVSVTGRKKLIMTAPWTEACLSFPSLDAMREGYETYPVVDAVRGTSVEAYDTAINRLVRAGAKPTTWAQVLCELQRDWGRDNTADRFAGILSGDAPRGNASRKDQ
jgi:nicotinamidase-related amidase